MTDGPSDEYIEKLAVVVREAWVVWAKEQPDPKPSWLVPWEELSETDKEADRRIARAVAEYILNEDGEMEKLMCTSCASGDHRTHDPEKGWCEQVVDAEQWYCACVVRVE